MVEAVRQRILDIARINTTDDPGLTIDIAPQATVIRSRTMIPGEITADPRDRRKLGVKISRLEISGQTIALDHPDLTDGWYAVEADGRWTNGRAVIPGPMMCGATRIHITLTGAPRYPLVHQVQVARR